MLHALIVTLNSPSLTSAGHGQTCVLLPEDNELTLALSQSLDSCKDSTMGLFCNSVEGFIAWVSFPFIVPFCISLCWASLLSVPFRCHCAVKRDFRQDNESPSLCNDEVFLFSRAFSSVLLLPIKLSNTGVALSYQISPSAPFWMAHLWRVPQPAHLPWAHQHLVSLLGNALVLWSGHWILTSGSIQSWEAGMRSGTQLLPWHSKI